MVRKIILHAAVLVLPALLLTACHSRKIEYSLKKIPYSKDQKLRSLVLDIGTFRDNRKDHEKNNVLFKPVLKQTPAEMKWYWNVDKKYKHDVPEALVKMLAAHLEKRGTFKAVKINQRDSADYHIEGNLHFFYAAQSPGMSEGAVVLGAVLPVLAIPAFIFALTEKTKTVVVIEIKNLQVYNRKNEIVFETDFSKRYERKYRSWGGNKAVYRNANHALKDYYTELVSLLEEQIKKAEG